MSPTAECALGSSVRAFRHLDELEELMLELLSVTGALPTPRPEGERMSGDGVDSLTLGAAPARDMRAVG
jgi:hypothetical protein